MNKKERKYKLIDKMNLKNKIAMAKIGNFCEFLIIEAWNNRLKIEEEKLKFLCSLYFDIRYTLDNYNYILGSHIIYECMKALILGYMGENKNYLQKAKEIVNRIQVFCNYDEWDKRIIALLTTAIFKLITNNVSDAMNIVNQLKKEQNQLKKQFLKQSEDKNKLIALYYMVKVIELISQHLTTNKNKTNNSIEQKIQLYIDKAKRIFTDISSDNMALLLQFFENFTLKFVKKHVVE